MRKYIFILSLLCFAMSAFSMPAKRGIKKNLTLAEGSTVTVTLCGDEFCHYWKTDDGRKFQIDENQLATEMSAEQFNAIHAQAIQRKSTSNAVRQNRLNAAHKSAKKVGTIPTYEGEKKGLVILVNFQNLAFYKSDSIAQAKVDSMFNQVGYSENGHIGSVHDYFYDQSYGKFDLTFDVVGPVTVSQNYSYYGKNSNGNDQHPCEMVIEACELVDSLVNFADYDWDGDGEVEQVYVVYAGHGEHASSNSNLIWPHEWDLASGGYYGDGTGAQTYDDVLVNTYAVSCELDGSSGYTYSGIGTACHEFSHCLGYPDFYDTDYSGAYGMGYWDILDMGSYNGPSANGEVPAGYTSFERWEAGWLEPTELKGEEVVDSMKPLNDEPEAYIIYNDGNPDEYYMLENRQPNRWFTYMGSDKLSKGGMLVLHVDYDADSWYENTPNDDPDHQRMTIVPANNTMSSYMSITQQRNQLYPYNQKDSLTNLSKPYTQTYTRNSGGRDFLPVGIEGITRNDDGTMSFNSKTIVYEPLPSPEPDYELVDTLKDQILFYESFNKCSGKGGNDDLWSGSIATATLLPDSTGWSSGYGANQCARFGTSSKAAAATSPQFDYVGDVIITFKAAAWNGTKDGTELTLSINNEELRPCTMKKGEWTTFGLPYTLDGPTKLKFSSSLRLFLDEVGVAIVPDPTGIEDVPEDSSLITHSSSLYNLAGQKVSADYKGIMIKNGKKIFNK